MKFYAPVDRNGNKVLAVWQKDGKDYAYLYRRANGNEGVSFALNELIPFNSAADFWSHMAAFKPATYRPYRRGEVKCGDVFLFAEDGSELSVYYVDDKGIHNYHGFWSYQQLLESFTKLDGSPAGVAE